MNGMGWAATPPPVASIDPTADLAALVKALSHDVMAPVRAVSGFAEVLREDHAAALSPQAAAVLARVVDGAGLLSVRVQALASLYRISPTDMTWCHVAPAEVFARAWRSTAGPGTGVHLDVGPLPPVWGDPALLVRLCRELLANAVVFGQGTPVEVDAPAADRGWVRLRVRDGGIGVDPGGAARATEVFRRLHGDAYPGEGVGLAVADRIARCHGGALLVEPAPGGGTAVSVTLPSAPGDGGTDG